MVSPGYGAVGVSGLPTSHPEEAESATSCNPGAARCCSVGAVTPRDKIKPNRAPALRAGDILQRPARTRGLIGVRRLAIGILQQQLEELRDRWLTPAERTFLLEACRVLVSGEKVVKTPPPGGSTRGSGGDQQGFPLPAVETKV